MRALRGLCVVGWYGDVMAGKWLGRRSEVQRRSDSRGEVSREKREESSGKREENCADGEGWAFDMIRPQKKSECSATLHTPKALLEWHL